MALAARETREARLALAQQVLGRAEAKTARAGARSFSSADETYGRSYTVPPALIPLAPRGALRAGSSVAVSGASASSLAFSLAAAAAGEESWCALVGMPDAGLAAARDLGVPLKRTALVPTLGSQPGPTLSTLIDGIDVLVLGPGLALSPSLWRSATSRARTQGTLLIAIAPHGNTHALSCDLTVSSETTQWVGLGRGSGRLRFRDTRTESRGKGLPSTGARCAVRVPAVQGTLSAPPAPTSRVRGQRPALTVVAEQAPAPSLRLVKGAAS